MNTPRTDIRHCEACGQVRFPTDHWQRKLAAAQADAERYRWLQESCCGKNPDITAIIEANEILLDADEMTFEQLDAAIDAAMKKLGK